MAERAEFRRDAPPGLQPYRRLRLASRPAKSGLRAYALWVLAFDSVAMIAAATIVQAVNLGRFGGAGPLELSSAVATLTVTVAWVAATGLSGAYDRRYFGDGSDEYRRVLNAAVRLMAVVAIVAFVVKYDVARGFVAIAIPLAAALSLACRCAARRWMQLQRVRRRFTKRVLIVGSAPSAADLAQVLRTTSFAGLDVVAACVSGGGDPAENGVRRHPAPRRQLTGRGVASASGGRPSAAWRR